jgi:hypothetical protein
MSPSMRLGLLLLPMALLACGTMAEGQAPSVVGTRLDQRESTPHSPLKRSRSSSAETDESTALALGGRSAPARPDARAPASGPSERLVVRSAFVRIERADAEGGVKRAGEIATQMGGWIQRSQNDSTTIMVPAQRLEDALAALAKLGKVTKKDVRGDDVTEEHLDLTIRLDNLEKARARYLELLARAASADQALNVEKELERVTMEIERIKGRAQYLEQMVRHSTIEVSFDRPTSPGPVGWVFYGLYYGVKWLFVWD